MNLNRSFSSFCTVLREDAGFRRLGRPPGWSVFFHYMGRWYDRRNGSMPVRRVSYNFQGQRMSFEMSDRYVGAFKGVFLDQEYDCSREFARMPRRIVDCGGNIGFGSVYFSKLFPAAEFAVIEPDPRNLPLLRRNLDTNRVRAEVIAGAIGPSRGRLALRMGNNPTCSSLAGTGMHDLSESVDVPVLTIPDVLRKTGWTSIDLLKIDIEGAEDALLAENNTWLEKVEAMLVEIHPNTSAERLNGFVGRFGFTLKRYGAGREPVYFARRGTR